MMRMFIVLAVVVPLLFLALFLALVIGRYRRLRRAHVQWMRIYAREIGELERLGPAAAQILFSREGKPVE
jgi:hypothetical protein